MSTKDKYHRMYGVIDTFEKNEGEELYRYYADKEHADKYVETMNINAKGENTGRFKVEDVKIQQTILDDRPPEIYNENEIKKEWIEKNELYAVRFREAQNNPAFKLSYAEKATEKIFEKIDDAEKYKNIMNTHVIYPLHQKTTDYEIYSSPPDSIQQAVEYNEEQAKQQWEKLHHQSFPTEQKKIFRGQEIKGSEIVYMAEGLSKGSESRLFEIEHQSSTRWDFETETLNKLRADQIIDGIQNKGLQDVSFTIKPLAHGGNFLRDQDNQLLVLKQIQAKEFRHEMTGNELISRIDKEKSFLEASITGEKQINSLKASQEQYYKLMNVPPAEKDIVAVVKDRITELDKAKTDLRGLEGNTFTLPRNDIYSTIKSPDFAQAVDKMNEVELTGSQLKKRIDDELKYYRKTISTPEKREQLRIAQSASKVAPEKDIIKIVEGRLNDMELVKLNLQGLDKASFTVKKHDTIHAVVKSPKLAEQINFEKGRFVTRDLGI